MSSRFDIRLVSSPTDMVFRNLLFSKSTLVRQPDVHTLPFGTKVYIYLPWPALRLQMFASHLHSVADTLFFRQLLVVVEAASELVICRCGHIRDDRAWMTTRQTNPRSETHAHADRVLRSRDLSK